jgi:hypothetical protein
MRRWISGGSVERAGLGRFLINAVASSSSSGESPRTRSFSGIVSVVINDGFWVLAGVIWSLASAGCRARWMTDVMLLVFVSGPIAERWDPGVGRELGGRRR